MLSINFYKIDGKMKREEPEWANDSYMENISAWHTITPQQET